jgi:hypothetical protein
MLILAGSPPTFSLKAGLSKYGPFACSLVECRVADEECLNRGWDVVGGNAFGELLLQRGQLLVELSNFGFYRWPVLSACVLELELQVVEVCQPPFNFVLDALASWRNGACEPNEGNGGWGEGNGSATQR